MLCVPPPPNGLGGIRVIGRKSHQSVGFSVVESGSHFHGLGGWCRRSTQTQCGEVGIAGQRTVKGSLQTDRLSTYRGYAFTRYACSRYGRGNAWIEGAELARACLCAPDGRIDA